MKLHHHVLIALILTLPVSAFAEAKKKTTKPAPKPPNRITAPKSTIPPTSPSTPVRVETTAEEADVQKIREKYWARGNEAEMGVVQNRLYAKRHRIELGLGMGSLNGDPFLSTFTTAGSLGFHFSEFIALHFLYWNTSVSPSSALKTLEADLKTTTNTNEPRGYYGLEARASILYGKLSLLGAAILYFDSFFSAGVGQMKTESGTNLAFSGGIGQQIHLSRVISLNVDYKVMYYNEKILGKVSGTNGNLNQDLGNRGNLSNAVTVSLSVFLNPFGG